MTEERGELPPDARALSRTVTELGVSRRNASIYPRGHPAVERSLDKALASLQKLLAMKDEIVLVVAKDSLVFDDLALEKRNAAHTEVALQLSKMNIVSVTFLRGVTKDELYEFHKLFSRNPKEASAPVSREEASHMFSHIHIGLVDYGAFSFREGEKEQAGEEGHLWERYVYGLLTGTLEDEETAEAVEEIPVEKLSGFLNTTITGGADKEACGRTVKALMKIADGKIFSVRGLRKLIELIRGLRPELKKEFLSSMVEVFSGETVAAEKALGELSPDKAAELLGLIREHGVAVPAQLEQLLDKFRRLHRKGIEDRFFEGSLIMDDIMLSAEVATPAVGNRPKASSGDEVYQGQILRLLDGTVPAVVTEELKELKRECSEEYIEKDFNDTILEFLLPESSEEEYGYFVTLLREQADQFLWTGQYGEVMKIVEVLESNILRRRFVEKTAGSLRYFRSREFVAKLIDSFRTMGRQMRAEAVRLCEYCGEGMLSDLFRALIGEESQTVRRFFLSLIVRFGRKAGAEALKYLGDGRWFVTRNMLFIIGECGDSEATARVRPYCHHGNAKVGLEAVKCLLRAGDSYGASAIREHLRTGTREMREQAIALSGSFRLREAVPDLVALLKKRESGSADFYAKIPVVRALGQIGGLDALKALREVLATRSLLFKGAVEKLKEELYAALGNYPSAEIGDLIEAGLKSKNAQIRKKALQLKAKG
ncbi:MAG: hypothetical protein M1497_10165 [Nitrospirae bacterium]|nr:hypothetical protein [Nitrospirota bacterium]